MALLTAPAPERSAHRPAAARIGRGRRLVARTRSTPGRLTLLMLALLAIGLATGVAGLVGSAQRSSLVDEVRARTGPLAVQAQELYRSLSDADATAASAFLAGGVEPAELRDRYQADIAAATAALAAAAAGTGGDLPALHQISAQLPVYTGLVETARAYNRLGLPVGAAYLREASGLMREQLLPAAQQLYRFETDRLGADRGGASAFPWLALLLGALTLAGLVWAQLRLSRQTRRTFNIGLAAATLAGLVMASWIGIAWIAAAGHLHASNRDGSAQVELLARARIAALQARADEALTLVARGTGEAFEKDFISQLTALAGPDGTSGVLGRARAAATDAVVRGMLDTTVAEVRNWRTVHQRLRELDNGGNYAEAVKLAIGTDTGSAASIFNRVDVALSKAITLASAAFDRRAARAADALGGENAAIVVLTILLLAGVAVGFQQRIAEYR
jgi:hypothetical protein